MLLVSSMAVREAVGHPIIVKERARYESLKGQIEAEAKE